jgi:hypothetical protein
MKYAVVLLAFLAGCAATPEPKIEPVYSAPLPAKVIVLDADSSKPIATAEVELVLNVVHKYTTADGFDAARMLFRQVHLGYTDKDGAFFTSASHAASGSYTGLLVTANDHKPAFFEIAEDRRITFGHGSTHSYDTLPDEMTVSLRKITGRRELAYHHMTPIVRRWEEKGLIDYSTWYKKVEQEAEMLYELKRAKRTREKLKTPK